MNTRILVLLGVLATAPAALALGDDDGPVVPARSNLTVSPSAAEFQPMTRSERFGNYLLGLASPQSFITAAASAGIRQARNSPKEWQGGAEGYGYRFGDVFAQHVMRGTLQYGASAVLHEDNRYFVSGESGFFRRAKYALVSTFLARHDNGQRGLSFSRLGGSAGAAFISREWQPRSTTSAGDGAISFGVSIGSDAGFNLFREFWPDLKRRFRKD